MNLRMIRSEFFRRTAALIVLSIGAALLMMDYVGVGVGVLEVGEIADRDIRATTTFQYVDQTQSQFLRDEAARAVVPVFDHDANLNAHLHYQLQTAFSVARSQVLQIDEPVETAALERLSLRFGDSLDFTLHPDDHLRLQQLRWSEEVEIASTQLLDQVMQGYIIAAKNVLPRGVDNFDVIRIFESERIERRLDDWSLIRSPEEARQLVPILATQLPKASHPDVTGVAMGIAKSALRVNFYTNSLLTENRRRDARLMVADEVILIKKGTVMLREGDPVTPDKAAKVQAMLNQQDVGYGLWGTLIALVALCSMIIISLYSFGSGFIKKFSTKTRDLEALTCLTLLVLLIGRILVEASVPVSNAVGMGMGGNALWYATPFAAGAILVRILINSETVLVWVVGTAVLMGLMMEQQALMIVYFVVSGVVAAAGIAHTRERVHMLRAGLQTGFINAAVVLLIKLTQVYLTNANPALALSEQPLWDVGMAVIGGVGASFLALGLVPLFELFGFVTDFVMLELANLNHPLLRQLMLKAPGTYHHSMTMALLSEAAAESIGANALQTRIACYYHDIGKSLQPQFFIENQRGGFNPHDRLEPHQSARIIKTHVVDGAALGQQYKLPKPIMDAILMHHGTSLIKYFYIRAVEKAKPGEKVVEADYRYQGKRPTTREAGIIFLADRVEAACRTLKDPSAEDFRSMIQDLVNGAIAEGQLVDCPLTIKEIYTIIDVFSESLVSVHHHRIEYPTMPDEHPDASAISTNRVITLEVPNPLREEDEGLPQTPQ